MDTLTHSMLYKLFDRTKLAQRVSDSFKHTSVDKEGNVSTTLSRGTERFRLLGQLDTMYNTAKLAQAVDESSNHTSFDKMGNVGT